MVMFEPKWDDLTDEWWWLLNQEFYSLNICPVSLWQLNKQSGKLGHYGVEGRNKKWKWFWQENLKGIKHFGTLMNSGR